MFHKGRDVQNRKNSEKKSANANKLKVFVKYSRICFDAKHINVSICVEMRQIGERGGKQTQRNYSDLNSE